MKSAFLDSFLKKCKFVYSKLTAFIVCFKHVSV